MKEEKHDVVVVGAGPAGLSAAITSVYYGLDVLVIDSAAAGGALINQYPWKKVDNYLGLHGKVGNEAAELMVSHAKAEKVKIHENETVTEIKQVGEDIKVKTNKFVYSAKAVVLAIGLGSPRKLGVEGEDLEGVMFSLPNPKEFKGKKVLVVGGGDTAVEWGIELKRSGAEVSIVHRKDVFRATDKNVACIGSECVSVLWNTEVKKINGNGRAQKITLLNNKEGKENIWDVDAVVFALGTVANTEFLQKIGVNIKDNKLVVDSDMRTNIKGVFAAGDVVGKWIRIPQAVGEGGLAGLNAFKYVKNPYWA